MAQENNDDLSGLRAVAHPLRIKLLSLLTGQSMSAAEAARALGETQANVSYHLRRLASINLVHIVEETTINGGRAKRYRHLESSGEALGAGARDDHVALMSVLAGALVSRSREYSPDTDHSFTDAEVRVTEDDWALLRQMGRDLGKALHDMARPHDEPDTIRVAATIAIFAMDELDDGSV
jgi:DNA-binding transcriptional ArsR family regulator